MFARLYRKLLPLSLRSRIYEAFLGRVVYLLRRWDTILLGKLAFLFQWMLPHTEKVQAYAFIGRHGITSYPGPYSLRYALEDVQVMQDKAVGLPYVMHHGRKLYFPEEFNAEKTAVEYLKLIQEQDPDSPHRYVADYNELQGKILFDIGSAEGIFSLDVIEMVQKVYLFECSDKWMKPLEQTFKPWKDKVQLIRKYVSDVNDVSHVSVDEFLEGQPKDHLFLKMDIEGAERSVLQGAQKTLSEGKDLRVSVCTYHRKGDPEYLEETLRQFGFDCVFTQGYLFWERRLSKALIRASK